MSIYGDIHEPNYHFQMFYFVVGSKTSKDATHSHPGHWTWVLETGKICSDALNWVCHPVG